MFSNSPGGICEILGRDLARPENRYLADAALLEAVQSL